MTLTVLKNEETGVWSLKVHETLYFDNYSKMEDNLSDFLHLKQQYGGKIEPKSTKTKTVKTTK